VKLTDLLQKDGWKMLPNGSIVPVDTTEVEAKAQQNFEGSFDEGQVDRVFPLHYPTNTHLYYAGFEIFILKSPAQVRVGGIDDGPARRAGVHWGDVIVTANGVDPRHKSVAQLEALFSDTKPAPMTLVVDRAGTAKTFRFQLAAVEDMLRQNQYQIYKGKLMPIGIPQEYWHCWER
jgi:hypothetical protein